MLILRNRLIVWSEEEVGVDKRIIIIYTRSIHNFFCSSILAELLLLLNYHSGDPIYCLPHTWRSYEWGWWFIFTRGGGGSGDKVITWNSTSAWEYLHIVYQYYGKSFLIWWKYPKRIQSRGQLTILGKALFMWSYRCLLAVHSRGRLAYTLVAIYRWTCINWAKFMNGIPWYTYVASSLRRMNENGWVWNTRLPTICTRHAESDLSEICIKYTASAAPRYLDPKTIMMWVVDEWLMVWYPLFS